MPLSTIVQKRSIGAHSKEVDDLISLAIAIGGEDGIDESYENHLLDTQNLLESHVCSIPLLSGENKTQPRALPVVESQSGGVPSVHHHGLQLDDPLFRNLLLLLENFFTNTIETNLSLTEAVVALASCGYMRLEGWLLVHPSYYGDCNTLAENQMYAGSNGGFISNGANTSYAQDESERANLVAIRAARESPTWSAEHLPRLRRILHSLVDQFHTFTADIPEMETCFRDRKQAFLLDEKINEALSLASSSSQQTDRQRAVSPLPSHRSQGKVSSLESISRRLFSTPTSKATSRSNSPRGRQVASPLGRLADQSPTKLASNGPPSLLDGRKRAFSPSPLHTVASPSSLPQPVMSEAHKEALARKLDIKKATSTSTTMKPDYSAVAETDPLGDSNDSSIHQISVSHLLTNAIILQEFILELAALVQVRASLFDEVRFL